MCDGLSGEGKALAHTEQSLLRLELARSNKEAQNSHPLDCSLGRLPRGGILD